MNAPDSSSLFGSPVGTAILITAVLSVALWLLATLTAECIGDRKRLRTLPLMILVAMTCSSLFLVFFALAFGASEFLPSAGPPPPTSTPITPTSDPTTGTRFAPITVAAGLFGGVLFIAFTVLRYRSHVQADEKLAIEQQAAKLQTAQHFSERFAQAAEMLGSERTATRMGGVYALAALADEWTENRQQCVDLLCGYLRTPIQWVVGAQPGEATGGRLDLPSPPSTPRALLPRPENSPFVLTQVMEDYRKSRSAVADMYVRASATDEVAVRKAVVSSIARGTKRPDGDRASWSNMSFDLSRCYLEDLDFSDCRFHQQVNFNGSIFGGSTNMRKIYFGKNAQFDGCIFTGRTWFSGATFAGNAWFRASEFCKEAAFGRVAFEDGMLFNFAHFSEAPYLRDNRLGRLNQEDLGEIPIANWDGVSFGADLTACPDAVTPAIWDSFTSVQDGYRIICERDHPDRPLGVATGHRVEV